MIASTLGMLSKQVAGALIANLVIKGCSKIMSKVRSPKIPENSPKKANPRFWKLCTNIGQKLGIDKIRLKKTTSAFGGQSA